MSQNYTMEIDGSYPFGSVSAKGEEDSAAESQDPNQNPQQSQGTQPAQEGNQPGQAPAGEQQGQTNEGQQVPLSVVQSIRQELQESKQREAQAQAMLQQQQQAQQPQQPQNQSQGSGDLLSDYDDDDVITVADMKRVMQQQGQQGQQPQQPQQETGQVDPRETQMRMSNSDYDQTIQQLPDVLQQNPQLESAIRNSDNPYQTAYTIAKQMGGQGQTPQSQGGQQDAQRIQQNMQKPGTAGQVSGAGGVGKADYYANMSKEEFEKRRAQVLRG